MAMNITKCTCVATILLSFTFAHTAVAGKASDIHSPAPRAAKAVTATAKVSPSEVSRRVSADIKGSRNFRRCKTRACLHSHQH
jgi:hypothetical protein